MADFNVVPTPLHDTDTKEEWLSDLVGKFSYRLCKERFVDDQPSSTILIYFSGVLGFAADHTTFERPRNYTSKLSGLIYCARLCFLEAVLPRFAHESIGWSKRPRTGSLGLLNRIREQYMCLGCQSPFGELLSLRNFGRSLSRSDGPSFRIQWSPDSHTISWDGGYVNMDHFKALSKTATNSAMTCLNRLMYGLQPEIRLDQLRDRMSNDKQGYSFVTDPSNNLRNAYLELSSRACLDPIDGLMAGDRWKEKSVARYLEEEEMLLTQIMLIFYLGGGQAPRSTELFSIEHRNGSCNPRGLYVHRGSIVFVTRHSKARHSTNQEFQVARYLDETESELVYKYLVYVRPFVGMLNRECFGYESDRPLFFSFSNDPTRSWKVDALTKALRRLSSTICGIPIGVQVYRQLSIAVTERHVKRISRPFDRNDDKSVNANLEVVYAWQSGHRPVQRGTTYGIDAAFPDSLQPALLDVYRWASREWHNFLATSGSSPSASTASNDAFKALRDRKQSLKRCASEMNGKDTLINNRIHRSFGTAGSASTLQNVTSSPKRSRPLGSSLEGMSDTDRSHHSKDTRTVKAPTRGKFNLTTIDLSLSSSSESSSESSGDREVIPMLGSYLTDSNLDHDVQGHQEPPEIDYISFNSPTMRQRRAAFFREQKRLVREGAS